MAHECSSLQHDLEKCAEKESLLKKKLEEADLQIQNAANLISTENELKEQIIDYLTKLREKDECIKSLETELSFLMKDHEVSMLIVAIQFCEYENVT